MDVTKDSLRLAVLIALGGSAQQLLAQDAGSAATLEEVIVTAERREAALQDVPVSVAAFSADALEAMNVEDLQNVQSIIPNLNISPGRGNPGSLGFNIRGIGGGGVALYIDDVYFPSANRSVLRTVDIQSIEVLRGPQGTLFGRNSTGGAIRVTTRKPSDEASADIEIRAGNYDRLDVEGAFNVPLSDSVFLRGKLARLTQDGYVRRYGVGGDQGHLGGKEETIGNFALRWVPADELTFDFAARFEESDRNPMIRVADELVVDVAPLGYHFRELNRHLVAHGEPPLVNGDERIVRDDYTMSGYCFLLDNDPASFDEACHTYDNTDNSQFTGQVSWAFSDTQEFRASVGIHNVENQRASDWISVGAEVRYGDYEADAAMVEGVLSSSLLDGDLDLVSGVNYYEEEVGSLDGILRNHNPDLQANTRDLEGDISEFMSLGVFSQGTYHFVDDRTNLTLGLRYTYEEEDVLLREWESDTFDVSGWNDCSTASSAGSTIVRDPNCMVAVSGNEDWNELDWRLSVDHQLTEGLMFYASTSKAFKSGAFNHSIVPNVDPAMQQIAAIDAEQVINKEIGIRSDWFNNRLRLNLTYFVMDFSNRQGPILTVEETGTRVVIMDLGDVETNGWELDASVAATDDLTVNFSAGRADPQLLEPDPPTSVFIVDTPKYSANFGVNYSTLLGSGTRMALSLNYTWQDEYRDFSWCCSDGENLTPSYGLLNARAEFSLPTDRITVAVGGTNLTDKVYAVNQAKHVSRFLGPVGPPGFEYGTENWMLLSDRGAPRMGYASVRFDF